jgi:hypothetical protein
MGTSNIQFGIVLLAIILGVGFAVGRLAAPEPEAAEDRVGDAGKEGASTGEPAAAASFLQQRVAGLEDELARQQQHKAALAHELFGAPIPWPENIPGHYRTSVFEENVRSALEACPADVGIAGFECDEPPCLAMFRGGEEGWWEGLVQSCPGWIDVYGNTANITGGMVDCPGSRIERYTILGPIAPELRGRGLESKKRWERRWKHRTQEIKAAWDCSAEAADSGA